MTKPRQRRCPTPFRRVCMARPHPSAPRRTGRIALADEHARPAPQRGSSRLSHHGCLDSPSRSDLRRHDVHGVARRGRACRRSGRLRCEPWRDERGGRRHAEHGRGAASVLPGRLQHPALGDQPRAPAPHPRDGRALRKPASVAHRRPARTPAATGRLRRRAAERFARPLAWRQVLGPFSRPARAALLTRALSLSLAP